MKGDFHFNYDNHPADDNHDSERKGSGVGDDHWRVESQPHGPF